MDAFDAYGPNSQALTFFDPEENDLIGGNTQCPDFDCGQFTLPSQSQIQASQLERDPIDHSLKIAWSNSPGTFRNMHVLTVEYMTLRVLSSAIPPRNGSAMGEAI
ncbi:unnamed protein product, partial [Protopolystoma xenopodis]